MRHIETYRSFNEGLGDTQSHPGSGMGKQPWDQWMHDWNLRLIKADLDDPGVVTAMFRELTQNTSISFLESDTSGLMPPTPQNVRLTVSIISRSLYRHVGPTENQSPDDWRERLLKSVRMNKYTTIFVMLRANGFLDSMRALIDEASKLPWDSVTTSEFVTYSRETREYRDIWDYWAEDMVKLPMGPRSRWQKSHLWAEQHISMTPKNVGRGFLELLLWCMVGPRRQYYETPEKRQSWDEFTLKFAIDEGVKVPYLNEWLRKSTRSSVRSMCLWYALFSDDTDEVIFREYLSDTRLDISRKPGIADLASALTKLFRDPGWLFDKIRKYMKTHNETPTKVMAAARRAFPTEYDREFGEDDFSAEMAELGL